MSVQRNPVFTIGHSTHAFEAFLSLLQSYGVTVVADVRSVPFSRVNPQFNRHALQRALRFQGIKYVFLGRELGARSDDPSCYENGRVRYSLLARTELFKNGLERVIHGAHDYRIALMCAEKEPLECHRSLLIAPVLIERDVQVEHILVDGYLEPHQKTMDRLLDIARIPSQNLFLNRSQLIEEAMTRQEERIAYADRKLAAEPGGGGN